nr:Lipoprotein-releasing system transmembrane protein lolC [Klebsiella pneumoniae]
MLGALLASQLNNLMPIIGAFLDGAALPVAIEPLQVIVIARWRWCWPCCLRCTLPARCRHPTR